jgi:transcriptional regulator with XRE-family HTH domain
MENMPSGTTPQSGPLARAISAEVRATLARQNVTVKDLAAECGLSQGYLGKRLRDEAPLNANDFESICKALGKEVVSFVQAALDAAGYEPNKEQS